MLTCPGRRLSLVDENLPMPASITTITTITVLSIINQPRLALDPANILTTPSHAHPSLNTRRPRTMLDIQAVP